MVRSQEHPMLVEQAFDPSHRAEWLGGEAHVRFRPGMGDRRNPFRNRRGGFTGLTLAFLFLSGLAVGSLAVFLADHGRHK